MNVSPCTSFPRRREPDAIACRASRTARHFDAAIHRSTFVSNGGNFNRGGYGGYGGYGGGNRGYRSYGGYGYGRGYGGRDRGGYDVGGGVAALAAGAIIGGVLASQYQRGYGGPQSYCARTYRSYDPRSGTYLGYDGLRHPCG